MEINKKYVVPCIKILEPYDEWDDWERKRKVLYIPIIPHLHNDVENGQNYKHYHIDFRFIKNIPAKWGIYNRINENEVKDLNIHYKEMKCINVEQQHITSKIFIKNSKLKKCIHKGKCPHRGFDLSNEIPKNGIIKCPLHGLEFDFKTKKLC